MRHGDQKKTRRPTPEVFTGLQNDECLANLNSVQRETLPPAWRSLENWCGSVFCSSNFTLFLIMQCLIQWRRDSTVPIAYSADSYPVGRYENSSESSAKKAVVNADIFISLANWTLLFLLINVSQPLSGPASFVSDLWAKSVHTSLVKLQTVFLSH